jgi:CheY-like chemotaxis protein
MEQANRNAITILLIEDEPLIRMATSAILEDAGYHVLEEATADAALESLSRHPEVDVVITDVQMPGRLDGLALIEIIGQDYPKIQTVITSGRTGPNEARQCGAKKFLSKPYTAAAIQSAVIAVAPKL